MTAPPAGRSLEEPTAGASTLKSPTAESPTAESPAAESPTVLDLRLKLAELSEETVRLQRRLEELERGLELQATASRILALAPLMEPETGAMGAWSPQAPGSHAL